MPSPKKDDPVTDVAKKSATAYETLNDTLGMRKPRKKPLGSYDADGKLIPGTKPERYKKPKPGSYGADGKRRGD